MPASPPYARAAAAALAAAMLSGCLGDPGNDADYSPWNGQGDPDGPDLVVASITTTPATPVFGRTMVVHVAVTNRGAAAASRSSQVYFAIHHPQRGEIGWPVETVGALAPGQTQVVDFPTAAVDQMSFRTTGRADRGNAVREADESNNMTETTFTAAPAASNG